MAVVFTHFSRWVKSGKHKEPKISKTATAASSNVQSYSTDVRNKDSSFIRRKGRMNERRGRNHDEEEIDDKDYDMIVVESDCSEWVDLDWSIGWLEPHGPEFQGEVDSENSFAVLVPCYGGGGGKQQSSPTEGNSYYMEKWMSYLKKS